jgi:cytochrome c peroxidase
MKTSMLKTLHLLGLLTISSVAAIVRADVVPGATRLREIYDRGVRYSQRVEFPNRIGAAGNPVSGQTNFGLASDGTTVTTVGALFEGDSQVAGNVVGNGRVCATCHLPAFTLGLPPFPMSSFVPLTDALFTGLQADAGDEPQAFSNFNNLGLLFHRPDRFNPTFPDDSPFRQAFVWRKTNRIINTVFLFGFLNDGRGRELVEVARGAVFSHTQNGDARFDDIVDNQRLRDISAFMESQIQPPELAALLNPSDPMYQTLVDDPFYTVQATTPEQRDGQEVFAQYCMSCHNTPNVFSNILHVDGAPDSYPPLYGHGFDIGVAERNFFNLEFRYFDAATGTRVPIVLPLAAEDGTLVNVTIVDDVGSALITGRYEDLHRFKAPQLRRISQLGPYFHDNSAATLEDVVDYFNSDTYNDSPDGRTHPIHMNGEERDALLAFLRIL